MNRGEALEERHAGRLCSVKTSSWLLALASFEAVFVDQFDGSNLDRIEP